MGCGGYGIRVVGCLQTIEGSVFNSEQRLRLLVNTSECLVLVGWGGREGRGGGMGAGGFLWRFNGNAEVNVALLKPLEVPRVGGSRAAMIVGPELLVAEGGGKSGGC